MKSNLRLMWDLAKKDFKTKYAGSYLGVFWAFVQPVVTILLYWFVFEVGFRSQPVGDFPFVLWLMAGLIPWFMFQDAINAVTNCLIEYSYLVKKIVFRIKMLPLIKVISSLFVHTFFVLFMIVIYIIMGHYPTIYLIQIPYYLLAMIVLIIGLGFMTCAIVIFFRDLSQIVQIILQILIWMTPIMWNLELTIQGKLQTLFKLNPLYYIVSGYRDSLINNIWFWEKPYLTLYYWGVALLILFFGKKIFDKLSKHFADVL